MGLINSHMHQGIINPAFVCKMVNQSKVARVCNTIGDNFLMKVFIEKVKLLFSYTIEVTILAREALCYLFIQGLLMFV